MRIVAAFILLQSSHTNLNWPSVGGSKAPHRLYKINTQPCQRALSVPIENWENTENTFHEFQLQYWYKMAAVMYNMRTPALPIRLDVTNEQIKEYNSSTISTSTWDISDTHTLPLPQANGDFSFPACSSKKDPAKSLGEDVGNLILTRDVRSPYDACHHSLSYIMPFL